MSDILFIKTSSLGDVIHHMPALTEARAQRPGDRFSWVVEEPFAPLVRLHPAIDEVIPVSARRWRGADLLRPATWSEIAGFRRKLRSQRYDEIIDSQGLFLKSGLIAASVHGRRHGYDAQSIKERAATLLYDVRHRVGRDVHAVARNRALTGLALGYAPQGAPDYGLAASRLVSAPATQRYGVLLHATAQPGKEWPVAHWHTVAGQLAKDLQLILPWGTSAEQIRAARIAEGVSHARVADHQPLDGMARLLAGASLVVGVDTGLTHLAAALGVPLIAIFSGSEPGLTGPIGAGPMRVVGTKGAPPGIEDVIEAVRQVTR
jgi:heptosyltransferase-1